MGIAVHGDGIGGAPDQVGRDPGAKVVVTGSGVPEDIPEVIWSMGMAPGAPVMVLGGRRVEVPVEVPGEVPGVGLDTPELRELLAGLGLGLRGLELEEGFCLPAK